MRPSGIVETKRARLSAVSATPMKSCSRPVAAITGAMRFTRMPSGASSTAIDFVMPRTAPFELLYQVRPGRGRMAPTEPTLRITPPPFAFITGTTARAM
ncbi:hypothetical protein D9M72_461650 [compost metagenome]